MSNYKYQYFDIVFASNIFLPNLALIDGERFDYSFQLLPSSDNVRVFNGNWIHDWTLPDGTKWLSIEKEEQIYCLRLADMAIFYFNLQDKSIDCYSESHISLETIRHFLLNVIFPIVLSSQQRYFLHLGAIDLGGFAIGFLGNSGYGKSTLTTSFGQQGFPIITDDCVLVKRHENQFSLIPSPPQLRLWDTSIDSLFLKDKPSLSRGLNYTNKAHLYDVESLGISFCPVPVTLTCLYALSPPEKAKNYGNVVIEALSPREAMKHLLESVFRLDITDKQRIVQEFDFVGDMVKNIPCFLLHYPRNFEILEEVRSKVIAHTATTMSKVRSSS